MRSECIQAVNVAMGRSATQAEKRDIENRLRLSMRRKAAEDPTAWASLSGTERLRQAAQDAATGIEQESALRRHRVALGILAHDRIANYVDAQIRNGDDKLRVSAIGRVLEAKPDGKNNITSVWSLRKGIIADAERFMTKTWEVAGGRFLHLFSDPAAEGVLVRALHGDAAVPKAFQDAARDFHQIADTLRDRFNAAGGEIGKLENWGMPHAWSQMRLLKAGRQTWTDAMLPLLDRREYVHDDGSRYSDQELLEFLDEAWQSVVTGGANKILGGDGVGRRIKASRHSAAREIHLAGPDAYLQAMRRFSDTNVLNAMFGHIHALARDIALTETFGPNSDLMFKQALEDAYARDTVDNPARAWWAQTLSHYYAGMYNYLANGEMAPITPWGRAFQGLRNLSLLKLGKVAIHSMSDYGLMSITAHANGIPAFRVFLNHLRLMNPLDGEAKALAARAGLMTNAYTEALARYGDGMSSRGWTSKLGSTYLKVTLAPYMWHAKQFGFSTAMQGTLARVVAAHDHIDGLNDTDQTFIKHSGITDADWQVFRLAQPDEGLGQALLTPAAIYDIPNPTIDALGQGNAQLVKSRAASALMGFVYAEQDKAIPMPGARAHMFLGGQTDPDTVVGMLLHSFRTFKSFPFDITYQHFGRLASMLRNNPRGGMLYGAEFVATLTLLGALMNGIDDVMGGKDPRTLNLDDKNGWENWTSAVMRSGGLGIYGDLLFGTYSTRGNTFGEVAEGPVFSDVFGAWDIVQQTFAHTPDAEAARVNHERSLEAIRLGREYIPGSNMWYTKAAMDHLIFNDLSDYLSPGYLQRAKARARRQGETYWWQPDQATPDRAPDLSHVTATQP